MEPWQLPILIAIGLVLIFLIATTIDTRNHENHYPHPKDDHGRFGHIHFHSHGHNE